MIDREEMVDKVWNGAGVGRGAEWRGEGGTRRRRAQNAGLQSGCRKREGRGGGSEKGTLEEGEGVLDG